MTARSPVGCWSKGSKSSGSIRWRKKVPLGERQPLVRPSRCNEVWSVDFVFDRLADGRSLKCLAAVDDCTHEAVAIQPDRAITGAYVARILDRVKCERGLPKVIRSDNGRTTY